MILSLSLIVLLFLLLLLFVALLFLYKKHKNLKNDVSKIILAVKRVRYGDMNVRLDNLNDESLQMATNRLIETMYDREMMIKESDKIIKKL